MKHFTLLLMTLIWSFHLFGQCSVQGIYVNSYLIDPNSGTNNFDTDGDGTANDRDEFVQICNGSSSTVNLNGFTFSDIVGLKYTFGSTDSILPGECITLITDWLNVAAMPSYFREVGTSAFWNNGGDSILFSDGSTSCNVSYGSQGSTPEQDGCPTININDSAYVSCSVTPSDMSVSPLPVDLIGFSGTWKNNQVALHWITASEANNSHFEVERSSNGIAFSNIGLVAGGGNSNRILHYAFTDVYPIQRAYYRLKQVDFDQNTSYSNVIRVEAHSQDVVIADQDNKLTISVLHGEDSYLRIVDASGIEQISMPFYHAATIRKQDLSPGFYTILVYSNGDMKSYKVLIF